jgi:hypothetical protein
MVEAAGVEPITVLTARKLLILGSATKAKKAPLPDPLYVYCTKILALEFVDTTQWPQYPIDSLRWIEKKLDRRCGLAGRWVAERDRYT